VGAAPPWGKLLRACAMAQTSVTKTVASVTTPVAVYYAPVSTGFDSLSFLYYVDGVMYAATGARGSFELAMGIGEIPKIKFTFIARYNQVTPSAVANPAGVAYASFKAPLMVTNYNSGMVKIGAAFNKATAVLSGGDEYASRGFSFNMANTTQYQAMLGIDRVLISDRKPTGSIVLDLTAAEEVSFRTDVRASALRSLTFDHGTVAGSKILVHAPAAQLVSPKIVNQDGVAMTSFDARYVPTAGDDEVYIVCQ
jgi:Phage tail tube protein